MKEPLGKKDKNSAGQPKQRQMTNEPVISEEEEFCMNLAQFIKHNNNLVHLNLSQMNLSQGLGRVQEQIRKSPNL